jgi:hypothetical protein
MSQVDEEKELQEAEEIENEGGLRKLVPVTESIRYRKRAQSAERQNEALAGELSAAREKIQQLDGQIGNLKAEQKVMRKLISAGASDLEAAVLLVKARSEGGSDEEIDSVVEQLRKEKGYLFGQRAQEGLKVRKTSGEKERIGGQAVLEGAAKRAATTGDRRDLQEYLKLRRNYT